MTERGVSGAPRRSISPAQAYTFLTMTMLFWAINAIVARAVVVDGAPPMALAFWRWTVAALIILPLGAGRLWADRARYRGQWPRVFLLGALGAGLYAVFQYTAFEYTTAINFGIVNASVPTGVFLATWALGLERGGARHAAGLALSLVGVLIVLCRGDIDVLLELRFNPGDVLVLGCVVCMVAFSILLKGLPSGLDPYGYLLAFCIAAALSIAPFWLFEHVAVGPMTPDIDTLTAVAVLALLPALGSFLFWNAAMPVTGANRAALFINLVPFFISALALIFLGETLAVYHLGGLALIFAGIYLATLRRAKA